MANAAKVDDRPPLRAQQRSVADARILEGAMAVFAEKGLNGTVDDVAEAAGVGRKTVFRHFDSHGELFAAVIARVMKIYQEELTGLTSMDDGREHWLENTAEAMHGMNRRLLGRGFWDIHVPRPGDSPRGARRYLRSLRSPSRVLRGAGQCRVARERRRGRSASVGRRRVRRPAIGLRN